MNLRRRKTNFDHSSILYENAIKDKQEEFTLRHKEWNESPNQTNQKKKAKAAKDNVAKVSGKI